MNAYRVRRPALALAFAFAFAPRRPPRRRSGSAIGPRRCRHNQDTRSSIMRKLFALALLALAVAGGALGLR